MGWDCRWLFGCVVGYWSYFGYLCWFGVGFFGWEYCVADELFGVWFGGCVVVWLCFWWWFLGWWFGFV